MSRILIVDDSEENLYYLRALLEGNGCTVETARHGAEALVKARQNPPDTIISDLLMPVMDGYTLLRHWKSDPRLKGIPFIVYTATYTEPQDEQLALSLGADAFILKPSEPEDFLKRLHAVEACGTTATPLQPRSPAGNESEILKYYSEALVRKLEEKMLQLGDANAALQNDIAERKLAEVSLRESEQRFRELAENINEVFWITDPGTGRFLYISPAYEKISGHPCADLIKSPDLWLGAVHPDDRTKASQFVPTSSILGPYDETYRIVRPDGSVRWIRDRAFPVQNAEGRIFRAVGTAEDITENKLAGERLAEQAALLDAAYEAILVKDMENRIIYWNMGAERLFGWTAEEARGRDSAQLLHKDPSSYGQAHAALMETGMWQGEMEQRAKDGRHVVVQVLWTLVRDGRGQPKSVLAINNDITERKRLEAQFLRAQRMESIGALAGGIAHDLNNLLSPILMSVALLKLDERDPERLDLISTLEASASRGTDLIKQVLSFARGAENSRVPINLAHIARDVQKIALDTFPKNISLGVHTARGLRAVAGDFTQLHQVFVNLCVNARDAMPTGGRLSISLENADVDSSFAQANTGANPGPYVVVKVADTGSGIAPSIRGKIFDPFFTTKALGKGTGLGLSTTMAIVKSHGGFIVLDTELGRGTEFNVYLPASEGSHAPEQQVAEQSHFNRGSGEWVLFIDDEEGVRQVARRMLERFGYRVSLAANGAEAVSTYAQHWREIAVVITDMAMPIMDGRVTVIALKAINPKARIIGSSGNATENGIAGAMEAGAQHFISKPYTTEALLKVIQQAISTPGN